MDTKYYNIIYNIIKKLKEKGIIQNKEIINHCFLNYKLFMENYEEYLIKNLFISSSFEIIININHCEYRITKINKMIFEENNKLNISILEEIKSHLSNNNDLYENVEHLLPFFRRN